MPLWPMLHKIVHATMIMNYDTNMHSGVIKRDLFFNGLNFGHVTIFTYLKIEV